MIISLCTIAAGILLLVWIASALLAHHWQPLARSLGTVGVPLPPKTDSVTSAADLAVSRRDAAPSPLCERCASPKLVVQLTEAIAWLEALNVLSASRTSADACASAPGGSLEAPSQPIRYELPPGEDFVMVTYQQSWCVNDWGTHGERALRAPTRGLGALLEFATRGFQPRNPSAIRFVWRVMTDSPEPTATMMNQSNPRLSGWRIDQGRVRLADRHVCPSIGS